MAGEPLTRVLLLALRGVMLVGLEEVEAPSRRRAVSDEHARLVASRRQRDAEGATVVVPGGGLAVDGDLAEVEADGVESDLLGGGVDAADVEGRRAADAPCGDVERHVEGQVVDGEGSVALEVARAGGQREGTAGSGGGGQVLGGP